MENRARVDGFDMLRGLCAIGVAYYHLMHWFELRELYNLGLYGVYIFFDPERSEPVHRLRAQVAFGPWVW